MSGESVIIVSDHRRDEPYTAHFEDSAGRGIVTVRVVGINGLVNAYSVTVESRQGLGDNREDDIIAVTHPEMGRGPQVTRPVEPDGT